MVPNPKSHRIAHHFTIVYTARIKFGSNQTSTDKYKLGLSYLSISIFTSKCQKCQTDAFSRYLHPALYFTEGGFLIFNHLNRLVTSLIDQGSFNFFGSAGQVTIRQKFCAQNHYTFLKNFGRK